MESARRARPEDLPALEKLLLQATDETAGLRGGPLLIASVGRPEPLSRSLARDLEDPERVVILGALDGVPLGVGLAHRAQFGPESVGIIDTLYVVPDAREIGLGEAIAAAIMSWCQEHGCRGVDAPALPGSRRAKAFFEDNGFVARLLVMHRPLQHDLDA